MAEIVYMPKLSDTMTEGVVATWNKNVGDAVKAGEVLAEIETDKATMEFESFYDGGGCAEDGTVDVVDGCGGGEGVDEEWKGGSVDVYRPGESAGAGGAGEGVCVVRLDAGIDAVADEFGDLWG